jgi:hypothetical protein
MPFFPSWMLSQKLVIFRLRIRNFWMVGWNSASAKNVVFDGKEVRTKLLGLLFLRGIGGILWWLIP